MKFENSFVLKVGNTEVFLGGGGYFFLVGMEKKKCFPVFFFKILKTLFTYHSLYPNEKNLIAPLFGNMAIGFEGNNIWTAGASKKGLLLVRGT